MSKLWVYFLVTFLCFYAGCNSQKKSGIAEKKVELQSKSDKKPLPDFLVGRWKAADQNQYKWGFAFEKDGTVSALRNFMNMYIEVSQGGTYEKAADANMDTACTLGPVDVSFDPNSRILSVKVITDYFMFRNYEQILEGSSVDKIFGPVSQDGLSWNAEWQSVSRMLDGPPMDFNRPSIESVIFYKVQEPNQPVKGN